MTNPPPSPAEARQHLRKELDLTGRRLIIAGALPRESRLELNRKLGGLAQERDEVMDELIAAFDASDESAERIVAAIDAATVTERNLVASIPANEAAERLSAHPALRLRRHGARLSWAVMRDARPEFEALRGEVLRDYLGHAARVDEARRLARERGVEDAIDSVEDVYQDAVDLQAEISAAEQERARGVAEAGKREKLEKENARLRKTLERLQDLRDNPPQAHAPVHPQAKRQTPKGQSTEPTSTSPMIESPRRGRAKYHSKEARVGVFVDVANIAGAARRLHRASVDYGKLLQRVVGDRRLVQARAYAIDKGGAFDGFARAMRGAGYKVFAKKPKVFPGGEMKADWDVGMTVDILTQHDRMDVVILGSGDGDFVPVVNALKRAGLHVEVASFSGRTAEILRRAADQFIDLDQNVLQPPKR